MADKIESFYVAKVKDIFGKLPVSSTTCPNSGKKVPYALIEPEQVRVFSSSPEELGKYYAGLFNRDESCTSLSIAQERPHSLSYHPPFDLVTSVYSNVYLGIANLLRVEELSPQEIEAFEKAVITALAGK